MQVGDFELIFPVNMQWLNTVKTNGVLWLVSVVFWLDFVVLCFISIVLLLDCVALGLDSVVNICLLFRFCCVVHYWTTVVDNLFFIDPA